MPSGVSKIDRHADGVKHLRRVDRVLREVIDEVGPCMLRPRRDRFGMLIRSIISQQISTTLRVRFWRS